MNTQRGRIAKIAASLGLAMSLLLLATCESSLLTEIRAAGMPESYSYTVTFDSQGADVPAEPETMTVRSPARNLGGLPTDPEKDGLTFGGWWTDPLGHGTRFFGSTTVDADITVYALWASEVYEVEFDRAGGSGGTSSVDAILGHSMPFAEAPEPPADKPWLEFGGYYTEAKGRGDRYYDGNMQSVQNWDRAANTTLIAEWVYPIGEPGPAGGIVFYDKGEYEHPSDWRYLEVAPASTEWESKPWGGLHTLVGGTSSAIGMGATNTEAIVAAYGAYEPYHGRADYAAKLCDDLEYGGYDDWFLPTFNDLNQMYFNLHQQGLGGFTVVYPDQGGYWSSSESDAALALLTDFDFPGGGGASKHLLTRVRAARAF